MEGKNVQAGELAASACQLPWDVFFADKLDSERLVTAAKAWGDLVLAQRLGYLLDQFADPGLTKKLHAWVIKKNPKMAVLKPGWKFSVHERNAKWNLLVNEKVEIER
jgi:hypothetical protein